MIRAYPRFPSLLPGERLVLHVSTDSPWFRVEFFRQGRELVRMPMDAPVLDGSDLPEGPPDLDWGWTPYEFNIATDWPGGVYFAMLTEIAPDGTETRPDSTTTFATSAKAMFVLRHAGPVPAGTPLYKLSWATFVAYNATGYGSLYSEAVWSRGGPQPGFKVTWRRPGCGTGGVVMAASPPDHYAPQSDRQTFEHWDAPFVRWLEEEGYATHYCTDWDLHNDPGMCEPYSLLLSVGHDEYWSPSVRDVFRAHLERGGNIAFFTGNTCFWRIHFTDDATAITCAKVLPTALEDVQWRRDSWIEQEPETSLTCVTYELGGGWWDGKRQTLGFTVQHAGHWLYEGTGLKEGEVFGDDPDHPLIGYEVDGAAFVRRNGFAVPTGELGTPRDFVILGVALLGEGWFTARANGAATMGIRTAPCGGIVFQGATTDWPILAGRNPAVERITRNVLEHLRWPSVRLLGPLPCRAGRMVAEAGASVSFHADLAGSAGQEPAELKWRVAGGKITAEKRARIEVCLDPKPGPFTVSVEVVRSGGTIGFGTRTGMSLSAEDAARFDLMVAVREMAAPDEPAGPFVNITRDMDEQMPLFTSVHFPMLEERADRVRAALSRLAAARAAPKPKG
jgi:hypothetical protein